MGWKQGLPSHLYLFAIPFDGRVRLLLAKKKKMEDSLPDGSSRAESLYFSAVPYTWDVAH